MIHRTVITFGTSAVSGLVLIALLGRMVASGVAQEASPRVTVSKETTRITEPLRADGYVDYVAALNQRFSEGVTPDNNAAVLLIQALGPDEIPAGIRQQYFELLGVPPLPDAGAYLVAYDDYVERVRKAAAPDKEMSDEEQQRMWEDEDTAMRRPWSKKQLPTVAAWLQASEQPLALIIEASKRPRRYDPLIAAPEISPATLDFAVRPVAQGSRKAAKALAARAMFRLNEGRLEEAWQDALACHRLSRLTGQGGTLIDALIAVAIDGGAGIADGALLAHGNLTAAQARQMHDDLQKLTPFPTLVDAIDLSERYGFLECVQNLAERGLGNINGVLGLAAGDGGGNESNLVERIISGVGDNAINWDVILQMGNTWYDRFVAAQRKPTWAERSSAEREIDEDISRLSAEIKDVKSLALSMLGSPRRAASERVGQLLVAILMPGLSLCPEVESRSAQNFEVVKMGFLLAAYRADRGKYPAQLSELVPRYIAAVPQDFFSGRPLIYNPRENGFALYSIGVNGKDDGGLSYDDRGSPRDPNQDYDDLVVQVPLRQRVEQAK